ncbi:hypothetical protein HPP92_012345 [Vanilla planifolia]|uniref:RING-type domain-containing protein n=1 Tax=Vanilla planifolia TaxID=51239 RepID=A0A835R7J9_VANPL|nr:hypothetical protein HPP92_012345 [Vanilla planifolia]
MENLDEGFDGMPMEGDYPDNLSISLESFYKILNEEPATPVQNFLVNQGGCNIEWLDYESRNSEVFRPETDNDYADLWVSNLSRSNCLDESERKTAPPFFEPSFEHKRSSNNFSSLCGEILHEGYPHSTQLFSSNRIFSLPSVSCPSYLKASADFDSSAMHSYARSFGSVVTDGVKFHELQNNNNKCNDSVNAEEFGFLYKPSTNFARDIGVDGVENDIEHQDLETTLLKSGSKSNAYSDNISFPCSTHIMLAEKSGCYNAGFCDVNQSVMPDTKLQNGNISTSSESGGADLVAPLLHKISSEKNDSAWNIDSHDANHSSLTIQGDSFIDPEFTLRTCLPDQFNCLPQYEKLKLQGLSEEGACTIKEPSPCSSLPNGSVADFDSSISCGFCAQHCKCEVVMSESSTDSSPLPCSRNQTSNNFVHSSTNTSGQDFFNPKTILHSNEQNTLLMENKQTHLPTSHQLLQKASKIAKVAVQSDASQRRRMIDDDMDLIILDDISDPVLLAPSIVRAKTSPLTNHYNLSDCNADPGTLRFTADDERLTYRLALQDLSQQKSEANPPDGVLSVPLLRHQRIALSWMVQKETAGLNCCGGILADDQGLGKTISTIALILTERAPSSSSCAIVRQKCEFEPLNLDDEGDDGGTGALEVNGKRLCQDSSNVTNVASVNMGSSCGTVKGRPAGGTLVVCPTSVLRQWAEELQNKITSKADLSFLVYHGSSRTKDANELTKFDVVLTTYAIVSMEVPKQFLLIRMTWSKLNKMVAVLMDVQSARRGKNFLVLPVWVIIRKTHQVAPDLLQKLDGLGFLRYDPYAAYKSFCSKIKLPISRNPINGYKKLQAVLKTIMLRRTKGSLIDGKPIITLPPKIVNLKRVDFSKEELDFYLALEAESREQFKVYADAGTVKQNYVNILLMLLRLRQACDHPLLVKGYNSSSVRNSSLESAKKLPKDKKAELLSCIEAGLEICALCNDLPEDAVVSICGHVFCNQCICEYLLADDNICPSAKCRDKLSVTSVFSRDTLKRSLSEQDTSLWSVNFSADVGHSFKISQESQCSGSSKIRAVLEILLSLPVSTTQFESAEHNHKPLVNAAEASLGFFHTATDQRQNLPSLNFKQTEKAIVFSQWTRMLDLLEVSLKNSCLHYRRLDGTMSVAAREKAIKDFNMLPEVHNHHSPFA